MTMDLQFPSFDDEFERLGEFWGTLWETYDAACELARQYFADHLGAEEIDGFLAPEIQRYHAKNRLGSSGRSENDFSLQPLSRNGVSFTLRHRRYRIWKKPAGPLPRIGGSQAMFDFMNQNVRQFALPFSKDEVDVETNLVAWNVAILWTVDREFHFTGFYLALPAAATDDGPTLVHWIRRVELSDIERFIPAQVPAPTPFDDDLPFERTEKRKGFAHSAK